MRKILFSRNSECIQPIRELVMKQKHRTLVLWALDCAPRFLKIYERKYPQETRLQEAIDSARAWACGDIKMPVAKKAILAAHKAAREAECNPAAQAAARAIGHAAATVHVETHALGIVFYGLSACVYANDLEDADSLVERELEWFYERLLYWEMNVDRVRQKWAPFLLREDEINKEKALYERKKKKL